MKFGKDFLSSRSPSAELFFCFACARTESAGAMAAEKKSLVLFLVVLFI